VQPRFLARLHAGPGRPHPTRPSDESGERGCRAERATKDRTVTTPNQCHNHGPPRRSPLCATFQK
jgi:hypothetical protein